MEVAYADFVTAMMAFFLLMWLLNATTEDQRKGLADYFSPNAVLSHNSSGVGQPFGGHTAFDQGQLVSDRGAQQVTEGPHEAIPQVDEDDSDTPAQIRPYRDDIKTTGTDDQGNALPAAAAGQKATRSIGVATSTVAGQGDASRRPTAAELRAELERREKQAFDQAAQQIRDAVRGDPDLSALAKQLSIDMTPEGLRIQMLDEERQPMFPTGSSVPNDRARQLLQKVAPVLARLTQDISIAGHTDGSPFPGVLRTNWELSAERANATRKLLVDAGLQNTRIRSVTGNADRDPLIPADPLAAGNRRIAIVVLRSLRPQLTDGPQPVAPTSPRPVAGAVPSTEAMPLRAVPVGQQGTP